MVSHRQVWCGLGLADIVGHMHVVAHLNRDPNDRQAHGQDVLGGGAVVAGAHVALERVLRFARRIGSARWEN